MAQGKLLEYAAETLKRQRIWVAPRPEGQPTRSGIAVLCRLRRRRHRRRADARRALLPHCQRSGASEAHSISGRNESIEIKFVGVPRHFAWQNTEFIDRLSDQGFAGDGRARFSADASRLHSGAPTRIQREFESFFGCPVEFSGSADQFSLSNETLAIPLVTRDQHLLEALRPICEEAAKERNTAYGTLRSSVENEVQKLLPHGKANRQRVAKALGLTERTLAQKLGEENTSYEKVVDRLRHSLALQYIKEPSVSLAQIAWLLGYEGPTSFNHAFARWTGRSASEARSDNQRSNDDKVSKLGHAP